MAAVPGFYGTLVRFLDTDLAAALGFYMPPDLFDFKKDTSVTLLRLYLLAPVPDAAFAVAACLCDPPLGFNEAI